jgi:hypothetical protein
MVVLPYPDNRFCTPTTFGSHAPSLTLFVVNLKMEFKKMMFRQTMMIGN